MTKPTVKHAAHPSSVYRSKYRSGKPMPWCGTFGYCVVVSRWKHVTCAHCRAKGRPTRGRFGVFRGARAR